MPLIDVQRRMRELGRIRLGRKGPKGEPQKLDTFRLTSPRRHYLTAAATAFGGTVQEWVDAPTGDQYELVTDTNSLDVVVPPQRITDTQSYALWTAAGTQRRCDGTTQTDGTPCLCDPTDRECKPVTHLVVMLPQLPDLGVWRVTTTGYNAAAELPMTVDLLAALTATGSPLPAQLMIEHRTGKVKGQTRRYVVPTLGFAESIDELEAAQGLEAGTLRQAISQGPGSEGSRAVAARPEHPAGRVPLPETVAPLVTPDDEQTEQGSVADGRPRGPVPSVDDPESEQAGRSPSSPMAPTSVPPADSPNPQPSLEGEGEVEGEPTAAAIGRDLIGVTPDQALTLAADLVAGRPTASSAMWVHRPWVRRLFYAMERAGLWAAAADGTDPLHAMLRHYYDAAHLGDLRRDDLLAFCDQAYEAAEGKL